MKATSMARIALTLSVSTAFVLLRETPSSAQSNPARFAGPLSSQPMALTSDDAFLIVAGKIDAANREYRKVLSLSPKHPLAANNLALNLADGGGNLDEALKFAQIAREAAPEEPSIGDTLGWVYYRKGLIDSAYPLIADAASKLKNNASIRYHHGMVLAKKGKNKEAAVELKTALMLDSKFPGAEEARKTLTTLK